MASPCCGPVSGVEHQPRARGRMVGEDSEHPPLVVVIEVKKAVPGEDAVEAPAKCQTAHVGDNPVVTGRRSRDDEIIVGDVSTPGWTVSIIPEGALPNRRSTCTGANLRPRLGRACLRGWGGQLVR